MNKAKTIGSQADCKHEWRFLAEKYPDVYETCDFYWCPFCGSVSEYYLDTDEGEMIYLVVGTPAYRQLDFLEKKTKKGK